MCKFCKVEMGNCEMLACENVDISVGKAKLGNSEIGLYIDNNEDGTWDIDASYWVSDILVTHIAVPIKYCPFCGRKLHND